MFTYIYWRITVFLRHMLPPSAHHMRRWEQHILSLIRIHGITAQRPDMNSLCQKSLLTISGSKKLGADNIWIQEMGSKRMEKTEKGTS
jgi:hypothetical protein